MEGEGDGEDLNGNNEVLQQVPPAKRMKLAYASVHEEFEKLPNLFNPK